MSAQQRLWHGGVQQRVDKIAEAIPADAWQRIRVAEGAGPRVYDWAAGRYGTRTERGLVRWLLIRRGINKPAERAYYLCTALPESTMQDLAVAAGQRWSIESCFETAKQETGLDDYEVRSWHGWYRHVTLSMAAMALLTVIRLAADDALSKKKRTHLPKNDSLLAHSAPEATGLDARDCCPNTVPIRGSRIVTHRNEPELVASRKPLQYANLSRRSVLRRCEQGWATRIPPSPLSNREST